MKVGYLTTTYMHYVHSTHLYLFLLSVAEPIPVTREPSVTDHMVDQLGFEANYLVALQNNVALLAHNNNLMKYSVDNGKIHQLFEKQLPGGLNEDCHKHLLEDGHIALRSEDGGNPTYLYNSQFEVLTTYNGKYGRLIGTLPPDLLVYASGNRVNIFSVGQNHNKVMTLVPCKGRSWGQFLSICRHPRSGFLAVVDSYSSTLDIYSREGKFP